MARKTLKEQKAAKALKTAEQTALKNETAAEATAEAAASSIKETKTPETVKEEVKKVDAEKNPLIILALSMISFSLVGGILYFIKK